MSDPKYAAPVEEWPQKGSSGSGNGSAYSVQARLAYPEPRTVCGHILDLRWRTLHFERSPIGVPAQPRYAPWAGCMPSLMSYQAAQALRWWFTAQAELEFSCLCVETRLVEHQITYTFSEKAVRAGALISGFDRSNIMFGWEDQPSKTVASHDRKEG